MIEEKNVIVDNVRIRYLVTGGSEINLLLLHGLSFNADTWMKTGTMQFLDKQGVHALAIDFPGFGGSEKDGKMVFEGYPFTTKNNVDRSIEIIHGFLEKCGTNSISILGPSMGGDLALHYAIAHSDLVNHLVLVGPARTSKIDDKLLRTIAVKTLIMYGENDKIVERSDIDRLHREIPDSKLIIYHNAPHPVYLEIPERFHSDLINFLRSV